MFKCLLLVMSTKRVLKVLYVLPFEVNLYVKHSHSGVISQILYAQMTYQPKSVGKMADFETLILHISLDSSQIFAHSDVISDCLCQAFSLGRLSAKKCW